MKLKFKTRRQQVYKVDTDRKYATWCFGSGWKTQCQGTNNATELNWTEISVPLSCVYRSVLSQRTELNRTGRNMSVQFGAFLSLLYNCWSDGGRLFHAAGAAY